MVTEIWSKLKRQRHCMKQKQQSNSGHRNFSLYCKRNLSHAKKMIPIYKNLENCEKRHKKTPLSKKKKTTRTPAI